MKLETSLNSLAVVASARIGQRRLACVALSAVVAALSGCAVSEINANIDALNRSIKGTASEGHRSSPAASTPKGTGDSPPNSSPGSEHSVSFKRRVPGGADIVRMAVEDGAMQLRVGYDFSPTATVDNAMPFNWSASCDIFYLVDAHLPAWNPPPDRLSGLSFKDVCTLDEAGLAFHRSAPEHPIRRRNYQLTTSFGVADAVKEWRPVYETRRAEFKTFQGDRYFFVGVSMLDIKPYDAAKQGFFVTVDLRTFYTWNKPIVLVGKQLSSQRLNVNLKTEEALARTIDSARLSNYRLGTRQTKVVFKLNGVKEFVDRIEINITLEKVEVPIFEADGKSSVLVNMI